jgi:hypothetical protein
MIGGALVFLSFLTFGLETSFFEKQLALFKPQFNLKKFRKFAF